MPADAAAEHTTSGSEKSEAVTSSDEAENNAENEADAATPGAADPAATAEAGTATDSDSAPKTTESVVAGAAPAADDATVTIGKASAADEDEASTAEAETAKADSGDTVAVSKPAAPRDDSEKAVDSAKKADDSAKKDDAGNKPADAADSAQPGGRRFPLPALIGAAVLLVAALVAVGVFFFLAGNKQDELDRRAAATKAACDFGNNFATYTGDKADDYLQRLDQSSTGDWKKLVSQIGPDLKARFAESKVTSSASAVQCGYESGSGDDARVVLVIDQQFTTADVPQQQGPGQVKVAANVSMKKVDGTWLVADFDTPMMQQ
ncbi:hypothetical protein [Nocardia sp. NBC_00416]|uniref:hypothetical protein n=1 Tax=Nocardia sp. NBC_00416 TaxID=2975991 RepID=UPI002E1F9AED